MLILSISSSKDQRIAGVDFAQTLNDFTGHRTDVGFTVTANFGFVTHAA